MDNIKSLLFKHGFKLVRQRKHFVYKNGKGMIFVIGRTPSDHRSNLNNIKRLERMCKSQR